MIRSGVKPSVVSHKGPRFGSAVIRYLLKHKKDFYPQNPPSCKIRILSQNLFLTDLLTKPQSKRKNERGGGPTN